MDVFWTKSLVLTFKLKYKTNSVLRFKFNKELETVTSLARLTYSCCKSPCFRSFRSLKRFSQACICDFFFASFFFDSVFFFF